MQGNKSEKAITETQVTMKQPVLSLKDTTLSKIVKKQMQNGKNLLTDNQYYILRERN
jgi:hypothetical protein